MVSNGSINTTKFGYAYFRQGNSAIDTLDFSGFYSINGKECVNFKRMYDLPKNVIFFSNLTEENILAISSSFLKSKCFFGVDLELLFDCKIIPSPSINTHDNHVNKIKFISTCIVKYLDYISRRTNKNTYKLIKDNHHIAHILEFNNFSKSQSMIIKLAYDPITTVKYRSGYFKEGNFIELSLPVFSHILPAIKKACEKIQIPDGNFVFKSSFSNLEKSDQIKYLKELNDLNTPFILSIKNVKKNDKISVVKLFLGHKFDQSQFNPILISSLEYNILNKLTDFDIVSLFVSISYKIENEIKFDLLPIDISCSDLSIVSSVIAHSIISALSAPIINNKEMIYTSQGYWFSVIEKIYIFNITYKLSLFGVKVVEYGKSKIKIFINDNTDKNLLMLELIKLNIDFKIDDFLPNIHSFQEDTEYHSTVELLTDIRNLWMKYNDNNHWCLNESIEALLFPSHDMDTNKVKQYIQNNAIVLNNFIKKSNSKKLELLNFLFIEQVNFLKHEIGRRNE